MLIDIFMFLFCIFTYIYIERERGAIRALGAGVIMLDNYIRMNMTTCSKTLQMPVKQCILNAYDFQYIDISKGEPQYPENRICFKKGANLSSNCKPFA